MSNPAEPIRSYFSGVYWLRSKIPVSDLHGKKCLLRIHNGPMVREGIFTFDARAHGHFAEYHQIQARHTALWQNSGTTTIIVFDQYRADHIRRADAGGEHSFVADIDGSRPIEYVTEIQDAVDAHLLGVLKEIQERHASDKM